MIGGDRLWLSIQCIAYLNIDWLKGGRRVASITPIPVVRVRAATTYAAGVAPNGKAISYVSSICA